MKPTKAYILKISSNPLSVNYAKMAADSCDKVGLKWDYFEGYNNLPTTAFLKNTLGIKHFKKNMHSSEASISMSHFKIWEKIIENKETAIILEHDAIMLYNLDLDIPNDTIVNLGYKLTKPEKYNYLKAGNPKQIRLVNWHSGAHAYCINETAAKMMLEELRYKGLGLAIDGFFFLRWQSEFFKSKVKIAIVDPICAIGFVRETTNLANAGGKSSILNAPLIKSFSDNMGL
jgi:GR25 family glycosyltransferase involved in LPS biosynthesis